MSVRYTLYTQHCKIRIERPMDKARTIAAYLVQAINKLKSQTQTHLGRHTTALDAISKIFKTRRTSYQVNLPSLPNQRPRIRRSKERSMPSPVCTSQSSRNNIPIIILQQTPSSKGEELAAPSEGAPLPTPKGESTQDWYSTPRKNRKITSVN